MRLPVLLLLLVTLTCVSRAEVDRDDDDWEESSNDAGRDLSFDEDDQNDAGYAVSDQSSSTSDEGDEENSHDAKDEASAVQMKATTKRTIATNAMKGALDAAQVSQSMKDQVLSQVRDKLDGKEEASGAVSCATYALGTLIEASKPCKIGNTMMCLTSELDDIKTSSCDKGRLCSGLDNPPLKPGEGYYNMGENTCGSLPGTGQKIYCSKTSPKDGRIPDGVSCPKIKMRSLAAKATSAAEAAPAEHSQERVAHAVAHTVVHKTGDDKSGTAQTASLHAGAMVFAAVVAMFAR